MKNFLYAVLVSSMLAGCVSPAVIKQVEDKQLDNLPNGQNTKPIQFSKIVVKLKRGEKIGALQAGLLCVGQGVLNWKGGKLSIDSDEFTEAFKEELEKASFKTVGDSNALFEDTSSWKAEILVAGLVKDLKANICYPNAGFGDMNNSKGEAYLKVDWQIYSRLDRSVVHSVTTEGTSKVSSSVSGGDITVVLNAFTQAVRNLLADEKFRLIVSKGGDRVKETMSYSAENIIIQTEKRKLLGNNSSDWQNSVATVFAGNGHGSGFLISDNILITNHHVIGESKTVNVKFGNGIELLGNVIAYNSGTDVAAVKLNAVMPKYFKLDKNLPQIGTDVYAVGTPLDASLNSTVSKGIVSSIRQDQTKTLIQSDVNIQRGNSGGPLINKNGDVIGLAVSGLLINDASQGLNFFIPIADAISALKINY